MDRHIVADIDVLARREAGHSPKASSDTGPSGTRRQILLLYRATISLLKRSSVD